MGYTKKEAIYIVTKNAKRYEENLCNKNMLIVYSPISTNVLKLFEATFGAENYMHLTGLDVKYSPKISGAKDFYDVCLNNRLSEDDFGYYGNGDTERKLDVLSRITNIATDAKMFGEFAGGSQCLYTERLAGGQHYCLGFQKISKSVYVPNTSLKKDIRALSKQPLSRIVAILLKHISEEKYTKFFRVAKGYSITSKSLMTVLHPLYEPCNEIDR